MMSFFCTEGRHQAYGWSLPVTNESEDNDDFASIPIPVYCRPLNTEAAMKVSFLSIRSINLSL